LNGVMFVIVVRVLFWATGSQQSRFLLPLYPLFAVFAAKILIDLTSTALLKRWQRIIFGGLLGANILVATITLLIFIFVSVQPLGVITGFESKRAFLRRYVPDYIAVQQVMEDLSAEDRVLFMWDGMGYYCDQRCVPDPGQLQWTYIAMTSRFEQSAVVESLRRQGITHLLLSLDDANFILPFHDPTKIHQQALDFFQQEFRLACTTELYRDDHVILYELTCLDSDGSL
ncbi:MAG: hypothetical protein R3264_23530, partial [Anaerolineae bacterium]|nr:hypothetical protein [Anaerolineae bacterium]